jgi:hypothetical protein
MKKKRFVIASRGVPHSMRDQAWRSSFFIIFILSGLSGLLLSLYIHRKSTEPVTPNDVQLIETFHSPALFVKQLIGDPLAGKKIFREFCASCHDDHPRIDVPAPRLHDH